MKIGLIDVGGHNFPNLPIMKLSTYYKARGHNVTFNDLFENYDKAYISKVFNWSLEPCIIADEIHKGGSGYAIQVKNGREIYDKKKDEPLESEIEYTYPDYDLYGVKKAYGFLTRGCPNNCSFCIVSAKEGCCSHQVTDLSTFWRGQKEIVLMDANILACKDREKLLQMLVDSKAKIDYTQGLDARFVDDDIAKLVNLSKIKTVHFAFDFMKNERKIIKGLQTFKKYTDKTDRELRCYVLTNYDTTFQEDLYRIKKVIELGYRPDVRIYQKDTAPKFLKDLQRWANGDQIYRSCNFADYTPLSDGRTMKQLYKELIT